MMRGGMQCRFSQCLSSVSPLLQVHPSLTHIHTCTDTETHTWASQTSEISFFNHYLSSFSLTLLCLPLFFPLEFTGLSISLSFSLFHLSSALYIQPFLPFCTTLPLIIPRCSSSPFIHPNLASLSIFPGFRHVTLFSALLLLRFPGEPFVGCGSPVSLLQHP